MREKTNILSISSFIPEQICDTVRFTHYSGERIIKNYCGYASDYISRVLYDSTINGAVFPKTCDSMRILGSYLENHEKFVFQIVVPYGDDDNAVSFYSHELVRYKNAVENYYDISIDDIKNRVELINTRNDEISKLYNSLDKIIYKDYLRIIHKQLSLPLVKQKINLELNINNMNTSYFKRGYLVGSFLSNDEIVDIIEENGVKIVGDNLPESSRLFNMSVDLEGNIYRNIAVSILDRNNSPTRSDFNSIIERDINEIKRLGVDVVIMIIQKYCEPYEYLYPVYKNELDKLDIPILKINLLNSEDIGKAQLQVETFVDMLK